MKFWLIVFVFTSQGEYMWKDVYPAKDEAACHALAEKNTRTYVNTGNPVSMFCVSNDHYTGKDYDEGIPLDFDDYQQTLNPMDRHE